MRNTILFILMTACCTGNLSLHAQQTPYFSQYYYNKTYYNMAFAPIEHRMELSVSYRNMWGNVEGAPQTFFMGWRMPLFTSGGSLGTNVMYDKAGNFSTLHAQAGYAYSLPIGKSMISAGLSGGVMHLSTRGDWTAGDPSDSYIPYDDASSVSPVVNVGIAVWGERYYAGVSSHHVVGFTLDMNEVLSLSQKNHMYVMGGYSFLLSQDFTLSPSGLLATDMSSFHITGNVSAVIKEHFITGVSYGSDSSLGINIGYIWKDFQINYCYTAGISHFSSSAGSSHEILLMYRPSRRMKKTEEVPPSTVRNVRFL